MPSRGRNTVRGAVLVSAAIAILAFAAYQLRSGAVPSAADMQGRFDYLSQAHTNLCAGQGFVGQLNGTQYLQGSCCSPMNITSYAEQLDGLRAYSSIAQIPQDPYNVSAALAKELLAYGNITLTPYQQAAFDSAEGMGDPCCCHCWRWDAFEGQAKYLIADRGFNAQQVARMWELEDGCGGPLDSRL